MSDFMQLHCLLACFLASSANPHGVLCRFTCRAPPLPVMQSSPVLWKELAKEVRASKSLLEGFLEPVAVLPSITDHRTQELVFEAAYRLWKVRRQEGLGTVRP